MLLNQTPKHALFFLSVIISCLCYSQQTGTMGKELFDYDWKFYKGGAIGAEAYNYDDASWRKLHLPHDWSIEDLGNTGSPFTETAVAQSWSGFTVGGTAWYRKSFTISPKDKGKKFFITFDGVYMNSSVWLNGKPLGGNAYGYTEFSLDISEVLNFDKPNIIAVKVSNEGETSRWYSGSGIYRHVWLETKNPIRLSRWGTFITTPVIEQNKATTLIRTKIQNSGPAESSLKLVSIIMDKNGKEVSRATDEAGIKGGMEANFEQSISLKKFNRWSADDPYLYTLISKVYDGNKLADSSATKFGIRSLKYSTEGFFLNGSALKLKGGCLHHDNGPLGAKAFDRAEERRIEILKSAGYNAVRTSHNPPSHAFLDACDRLGMLVIDEAFDCWREGKNPYDYNLYFDKNWKKDIDAMVLRDRNHPSIIMWSSGNEIPNRQKPEVAEVSKMISAYIKTLDTTRPVTSAVNELSPNKDLYFSTLDIAGYNYAAGGDHLKEDVFVEDHKRVPARIMYEAEAYPFEAYDSWKKVLEKPYVLGAFVWTAFDYIGEASIGWRGYWPDKNIFPWTLAYCGDIDICGNKRPAAYYREALWKKNQLSLFVTPPVSTFPLNSNKEDWSKWHWYDVVQSWNHEGYENKPLEVVAYSSCDEVELFLDNKSLGKKPTNFSNKHAATWQVPYAAGTLKAIGYSGNKQLNVSTLQTAERASTIKMVVDRSKISADGQDLSYVQVNLTDAKGVINPNAEDLVKFELDGPGEIVGVGNAKPTSLESYQLPQRKAWQGKCLVVIRSTREAGTITLRATADGLTEARTTIQTTKK